MSDLLNVALSGLNSAQRGLAVTGHNISNVNTPGYSRQYAIQTTREAQGTGAGFFGTGSQINSIQRSFDALIQSQLRGATSEQSRLYAFSNMGLRLDGLNANPETGLSGSLERFFNALQGVASSPTDSTTRELLLSEARALVGRVNLMANQLSSLEREVNMRIEVSVSQINSLASSIADVNERISFAVGAFGQPPNDLLDRRDELLTQLSRLVNVSTNELGDGSVNVFIGQGQPLVLGNSPNTLTVLADPFDANRVEIAFDTGFGRALVTNQITGGEIGGLLDARRDLIDPARLSLGLTVTALTQAVNEQHQLGMDLRGDLGGLFFGELTPQVARSTNNTTATEVTLSIDDWQALEASDYNLRFDGTDWVLSRASNGEAIPMTGSGTPADPFMARGMSIAVSGIPANGDAFRLSPVGGAPEQFQVAIHDLGAIAAAAPVQVNALTSNMGSGVPSVQALDVSDPLLLATVDIEFLSPTSYSVDGGPPQAWAPGDAIEVNGWRLDIAGQPDAGDRFEVGSNVGAVGDNRNMLAMDSIRHQRLLDNGTTTIAGSIQNATARTAVLTSQSITALDTQNVVLNQVQGERERISGVNLDEEAARLVQLQQAYQASAQVIAVAATIFDVLLNATSRR